MRCENVDCRLCYTPDRFLRTCVDGDCCDLGPGHQHVLCADGIERLLWDDGTETDLAGYRSGGRDGLIYAHAWAAAHPEVFAPVSPEEHFARVLRAANARGSDALP